MGSSKHFRLTLTLGATNALQYYCCAVVLELVIESFRDSETEKLWRTGKSRRLPADLQRRAFRKLAILNAAVALENLRVPPGNNLEALRGTRAGQHSIRINDQYRICFRWNQGNAYLVEIVDYHH